MMTTERPLPVIITHMTIGDAIRLVEEGRPPDGVTVRCLIYVRISLDDKHDEHGVANQMAKLEQKAARAGLDGGVPALG